MGGFHEIASDDADLTVILNDARHGRHTIIRDPGGRAIAAVVPASDIAATRQDPAARGRAAVIETTHITIRRQVEPSGWSWLREVEPEEEPDHDRTE